MPCSPANGGAGADETDVYICVGGMWVSMCSDLPVGGMGG